MDPEDATHMRSPPDVTGIMQEPLLNQGHPDTYRQSNRCVPNSSSSLGLPNGLQGMIGDHTKTLTRMTRRFLAPSVSRETAAVACGKRQDPVLFVLFD
jgi:hypothetical protein